MSLDITNITGRNASSDRGAIDYVIAVDDVTSSDDTYLDTITFPVSGPGSLALRLKGHAADTNGNWSISAIEIGRVVGFYNAGGYHLDATTVDGYAPGAGDQNGSPHDSDFNPQNWQISAIELNRLVTFYNALRYRPDAATPDRFSPDLR